MYFHEILQMLRKEAGITQTDLAHFLNVSQQTIAKWENGITTPDIGTIIKIARRFNVTTDYLLGVSRRRNASFESYGDIMRILRDLQGAGVLFHRHDGPEGIDQIVFSVAQQEISTFYEEYTRLINLLFEGRITQRMIDSWYEAEMRRMDNLPLPQVISFDNYDTSRREETLNKGGDPYGDGEAEDA